MGTNPGKELYHFSNGKKFEFIVNGLPIVGSLNIPKDLPPDAKVPCLISFPGWKGDRKGKQKLHLGVELVKAGWAMFRLDPPGFGESDGNPKVVDLDLYANTIKEANSALGKNPFIDMNHIVVHGTSIGGSAAIMAAAIDQRISALVLWAPRSDYSDTAPDLYKVIGGVNTALRESGLAQDFYKLAAEFKGPVLIIHGGSDTIVDPKQSQRLLSALAGWRTVSAPIAKLIGYKDAGHTFGGFEDQLIADTIRFIKELKSA